MTTTTCTCPAYNGVGRMACNTCGHDSTAHEAHDGPCTAGPFGDDFPCCAPGGAGHDQVIERAAKVLHDLDGCLDPYGTCRSTSDNYRDRALADHGLLAGTATTTEADPRPCKGLNANICVAEGCYGEACRDAEVAKLRAERQKLQADRKRWNEFDLKTVQRFESERDQARADLAALRDKVRALHAERGPDTCAGLVIPATYCECGHVWPCATIALLADGGDPE